MIIRNSNGVTVEALDNIYKALDQVIKDPSCYYSKEELKELQNRDFINLEDFK